MGGPVSAPSPASKVVILYPLPGRRDWEFFAILTHAEPRPQTIDPAHAVAATGAELPDTPYIAAGLKLGGRLLRYSRPRSAQEGVSIRRAGFQPGD